MFTLTSEILVPKSLEDAFAFFENPRNLALITPPWLSFSMNSPEPVVMKRDAEIDYTIRWLGLPMAWKTLIAEYDPPVRFVDVQSRGPYRSWRHTHSFQSAEGGALISDRVDYDLPFSVLGRIAHRVAVSAQLRQIFRYRQEAIGRILGLSPQSPNTLSIS